MAGWNAPEIADWLEASMQKGSQAFFDKPSMYMGTGGTIPFMGMLGEKFPEAQFLITGLLGPNSNAHGPNEFLHIETGKRLTSLRRSGSRGPLQAIRLDARGVSLTWTVKYNESLGAIDLVYEGVLSGDDLRQATREGIALAQKHVVEKAIVDCAHQLKTGDVLDLYEFPDMYSQSGLSRATRIALVRPIATELHELATFYEDVCVNRGWQVKSFDTREEALAWLNGF